jgi:acyl dehydratase
MAGRYFEDIEVGKVEEAGSYLMTREEIVDFASKYDPQPFHLDEEKAKDSMFGELVASGFHTASAMMRMMVDNLMKGGGGLGSPGVDELRWIVPVKPGDVLRLRAQVLEKRESKSKPGIGIMKNFVEVLNQKNEVVLTMKSTGFVRKRSAG